MLLSSGDIVGMFASVFLKTIQLKIDITVIYQQKKVLSVDMR